MNIYQYIYIYVAVYRCNTLRIRRTAARTAIERRSRPHPHSRLQITPCYRTDKGTCRPACLAACNVLLVVMPQRAMASVTGDAMKMTMLWNWGERSRYL
jgi:hypothetical protein